MRQIVLDTETTGLDPDQGHRIIEIGCYELSHRRPTGRTFHCYLNPDRAVDAGALEVHGITDAFLADKPRFGEVAADFIEFIRGAEVIIHNAPFDVGFLDHELARLGAGWGDIARYVTIRDTLVLARAMHPGQRNTLDALCKRYGIDNSQRELHGALLDAQILADVYLAMTGGQTALSLDAGSETGITGIRSHDRRPVVRDGGALRIIRATDRESELHEAWLQRLDAAVDGHCLWRRLQESGE